MVERNADELLDAFISYSRRDSEAADIVEAGLLRAGRSAWIDRHDILHTEDWLAALLSAIERSANFVVLVSPDWCLSTHCTMEVKHAVEQGKKIVPILVRSTPGLSGPVGRYQMIDAVDRPNWDDVLADLLRAIDTDLDFNKEHAWLVARAKDWARNNGISSMLLRGDRITRAQEHMRQASVRNVAISQDQLNYIAASRRRRNVMRSVLAGASVATLVFLVVGKAISLRSDSRALAADALRQIALNPSSGLATAIRSGETSLTEEAEEALRSALASQNMLSVLRVGGEEGVYADFMVNDTVIALASTDGSLRLWSDVTGAIETVLPPAPPDPNRSLSRPSLNAAATMLATGSRSKIWVYDLPARHLREFDLAVGHVSDVLMDSSGKFICATRYDGHPPTLIDIASGEKRTLGEGGAQATAISPDGATIALARKTGQIEIWSANGEKLQSTEMLVGGANHIAFSPHGTSLVASGGMEAAQLWIFKENKNIILGHSPSNDDTPLGVKFSVYSPDGNWVATTGADRTTRLWDTSKGTPLAIMRGHSSELGEAIFSQDGVLLATAGTDGTARIWDPRRGANVSVLRGETGAPLLTVSFSRDGRRVLTGAFDGTARLWRSGAGVRDASIATEKSFVFDRDGRNIAIASSDGIARVLPFDRSQPQTELRHALDKEGTVHPTQFSPDGARLVGVGACAAVVWNLRTAKEEARIGAKDNCVAGAVFLDDSALVLAYNDRVDLWSHSTNWRLSKKLIEGDFSNGGELSLSPQRTLLAVKGRTSVPVYDVRTAKKQYTIADGPSAFHAGFSNNGQLIATASNNNTPAIWSAVNGKRITVLHGHSDVTYSANFSPDDKWLVTSSADGTAIVWSVGDWRPVTTLIGHRGGSKYPQDAFVNRAIFHPSLPIIATTGSDNRAILYDCIVCLSGQDLLTAARSHTVREQILRH